MAKPLVIVESPAKAKTLARFLGNQYRIEASYGHVRDLPEKASEVPPEIRKLPWGRLGVDVDGDFKPHYVVPADKKKQVQALKAALKDASELFLATDPDREGESISWHLREILKPKVPVRRIVFHEITEEAVREALAVGARPRREPGEGAGEPPHPGPALRLHAVAGALEEGGDGPERGPRPERGGAPAGRARGSAPGVPHQRLLGHRGDADRTAAASSPPRSCASADERVATGKDFDSSTGKLASQRVRHLDEPAARRLADGPAGAPALAGHVGRREARRRAAGAAVHHVHPDAGSQPQARLLDRAHDADRAAAVPGHGDRQRRDRRPDHLSPHRLDDAQREGDPRGGARHPRDVRRRLLHGAAALPDARQERAGSARGDPADRLPPGAEGPRGRASLPTSCASTSSSGSGRWRRRCRTRGC